MTLIKHLVWHDLRSQRLALLAFGAFLLLDALVGSGVWWPAVRWLGEGLIAGRLILVAFVTGLVVQQDSLVGTTAFWRTRPIARATLLASKAVTLGVVLIGLPGVIAWLVWLRLGLYAGDAAVVAVGVMLENATIVLLTAMAASVTPTLTYLIVAGVAGGTMVSLINSVLLPTLLTTWPFVGQSLTGSRPAVYLGTLFALGAPTVAYQYLRLKEWHTASMVGIALLVATGLARLWPAPPPPNWPPADPRVLNTQAITLVLRPDSLRRGVSTARVGAGQGSLVDYGAAVTTEGQPPGVLLWIDTIESRLLLRDRTVMWARQSGFRSVGPAGEWWLAEHRALGAAVAPAILFDPSTRRSGDVPPVTLMALSEQDERKDIGQRALLTSDVSVLATRLRIAGATHPVAGSVLRVQGGALRVLSATTNGRSVVLQIRASRTDWGAMDFRARPFLFQRLVLRNPSTRQAFLPQYQRARFLRTGMGVSGIMGTSSVMTLKFLARIGTGSDVALDAAWLAGAELVAVEPEALGAFSRLLQTNVLVGTGYDPTTAGR